MPLTETKESTVEDAPNKSDNRGEERASKMPRTEAAEGASQAPPGVVAPVPPGGYWHRDGSYHDDLDAIDQPIKRASWADFADEEDEEREADATQVVKKVRFSDTVDFQEIPAEGKGQPRRQLVAQLRESQE